jgi:toxin ParE1/3/4
VQAMRDVAAAPDRPGVVRVGRRRPRLLLYHARLSRSRTGGGPADRVAAPRHALVFRIGPDGVVEILGFLHDSMLRARALRRIGGRAAGEET